MNENLTVRGLSEKKRAMDEEIKSLISSFSKETGLTFKGVTVNEIEIKVKPYRMMLISTEWDMGKL